MCQRSQKPPVPRPTERGTIDRSRMDAEANDSARMLEEKRLSNEGTDAAGTQQPGKSRNEVNEKNRQMSHRRMVSGRGIT
jgi:hypothetical protein